MWHMVARTVRGRLLFSSWVAGREVWNVVVRVVPAPEALCVMPDHLHVVAATDARRALAQALAGLARSRNAREGRRGALVRPLAHAHPIADAQKLRRTLRYVHLNPNRARLVSDPLDWPFSTHRDALGLTWNRVGPRRRVGFHEYVSCDPSVAVSGTELPGGALRTKDPMDVLVAVSSVLRLPMDRLGRDPLARSVVWEACGVLCPTTMVELASRLGIGERTLRRRRHVPAELLALVQRVLGDPRFGPVDGHSLLGVKGWGRYRAAWEEHRP